MEFATPHGVVQTPTFMPVGTRAYVNLMTHRDLLESNTQIILGGNTYHMLCNPGMQIIRDIGGMHTMMHWQKPMLTDSGGFQVFSLSQQSDLCKITEEGARFKHPVHGNIIHLNAQTSIEAQKIIGADIIMAFDQCTPEAVDEATAEKIMQRTHRWLLQSKEIHDKHPASFYGLKQALFGIIQGGVYQKLREQSAQFVTSLNLDGIAIGGESIGFNMEKTVEILQWLHPILPDEKIRYTMGVGLHPRDIIAVVEQGADIFDCVAPTRNARHGSLYHGFAVEKKNWFVFDECGEEKGQILIKKSKYATDENPILKNCRCDTCQHHPRSYLHYLFKQQSPLYHQLACIHNVSVMQNVCDTLRAKISL